MLLKLLGVEETVNTLRGMGPKVVLQQVVNLGKFMVTLAVLLVTV